MVEFRAEDPMAALAGSKIRTHNPALRQRTKRRTTTVLLGTYVITTLTAMIAWFWLLAKVVLWIIGLA